ncbi:ABC transporter ATP-binding protein [Lentilitoribacter sp. Alg239-R112]|uniref:ABC transporter ATP-binding protein n=1 Tax=Lentilitoribacter sp. Alg239-R112 TaxID=2305987 RepID=UPI0013A6C300|nr:ABC transporter ATP-binding protein [Lentilitoribacter sp. Alg239-R112]
MLAIQDLNKKFGAFEAVKDVSIYVPAGAFLVLLGPSGCGKTTLLRMLAGLELPSGGEIIFDNQKVSDGDENWSVDPAKRNSGLVFQSYALWPHMSVRGNVEWPLKIMRMSGEERAKRVEDTLKLLDIFELADRYPNEISGGQQQRVAIARTIAPKPSIMLFDEPLSNLDAKLRVEMRTELMRLHHATGATTVYVTHDQIEAMTMATHVAVMNKGVVQQFGSPQDLVDRPETAFVATFVGTPPNNLIPVLKNGTGYMMAGCDILIKPPERNCMAMYKAESLQISSQETSTSIPMQLVELSTIAGRTMVTGLKDGLRLTAIVDTSPRIKIGEVAHFVLPKEPDGWFGQNGARVG